MLGAGVLLYTSFAVLFSMIPIPIILLRSLCISMMHIFMFGFIFLDDISLGVPYIHFSGRLYVCSYVSWFACFHCWYSSHVWLLYRVVQIIIVFVCVCMCLYAFVCVCMRLYVSADCWILGDLFQLFLFME